jgi:hypothetical protein
MPQLHQPPTGSLSGSARRKCATALRIEADLQINPEAQFLEVELHRPAVFRSVGMCSPASTTNTATGSLAIVIMRCHLDFFDDTSDARGLGVVSNRCHRPATGSVALPIRLWRTHCGVAFLIAAPDQSVIPKKSPAGELSTPASVQTHKFRHLS